MRIITAVLLALLAPLASASSPVYRQLKDFVVACDNARACEVISTSELSALHLHLTINAGATGHQSLALESDTPIKPDELRVDGTPLRLDARHWATQDTADGAIETHDAGEIQRVLQALRNAGAMSHARASEDDTPLSLAGLTASLLLIDETQGRLGTVSALVRRGDQPASAVPAADALPIAPPPAIAKHALDEATRQRLIHSVRRSQHAVIEHQECFAPEDAPYDEAYALDDSEALVLIECWRGAYQSSSLAFRTPIKAPRNARRLMLELPFHLNGKAHRFDFFTNAEYAPAQARLTHFAKGRGMADCGESASWVFDGREFRLLDFSYLDACSGGMPGDWPTLWNSAPVR